MLDNEKKEEIKEYNELLKQDISILIEIAKYIDENIDKHIDDINMFVDYVDKMVDKLELIIF